MKFLSSQPLRNAGFTLLEMTIVIMLLIALIGMGLGVNHGYQSWRLGREAGEVLRDVHTAQRMFLSDNPTANLSSITGAQIIPYLVTKATVMPTVRSLEGATLSIRVSVSPPVVVTAGNTVYDPSGSSTDSLWDVGKP